MALSNTSGVYCISFKGSEMVYIGGSRNTLNRKHQHLSKLRLNQHCCKKMQALSIRLGLEAISFTLLEKVLDSSNLLKTEQKWLDIYADLGCLLNECLIAGSTVGRYRSTEEKRKISTTLTRKTFSEFRVVGDIQDINNEESDTDPKNLPIRDLKAIARGMKIKNYSTMSRSEMIYRIEESGAKEIVLSVMNERRNAYRQVVVQEEKEMDSVDRANLCEFWIVGEDCKLVKLNGISAVRDQLGLSFSAARDFTAGVMSPCKGFYLVATKAEGQPIIVVNDVEVHHFSHSNKGSYDCLSLAELARRAGVNRITLNALKNKGVIERHGWIYLGYSEIYSGDFVSNPALSIPKQRKKRPR